MNPQKLEMHPNDLECFQIANTAKKQRNHVMRSHQEKNAVHLMAALPKTVAVMSSLQALEAPTKATHTTHKNKEAAVTSVT